MRKPTCKQTKSQVWGQLKELKECGVQTQMSWKTQMSQMQQFLNDEISTRFLLKAHELLNATNERIASNLLDVFAQYEFQEQKEQRQIEHPIMTFSKNAIKIMDQLLSCEPYKSDYISVCGSQTKANQKKQQKKGAQLRRHQMFLKQTGVDANIVNGHLLIHAGQFDLPTRKSETFGPIAFRRRQDGIVNILQTFRKQMTMDDKIKKIVGNGYTAKAHVTQGKFSMEIDLKPVEDRSPEEQKIYNKLTKFDQLQANRKADQKLYDIATQILTSPEFYNLSVDNKSAQLSLNFSTGFIGGSHNMRHYLDNCVIIDPHTKTMCVPVSIATIILCREKEVQLLTIYGQIQELARLISKKFNLAGQCTFEDVQLMAEHYKIKVIQLGEDANDYSLLVSGNHCCAILTNTERNVIYADMIKTQYNQQKDIVIKVNPDSLQRQKPDAKGKQKREKLYIAWDTEYTHAANFRESEDKNVEQIMYCYSLVIFADSAVQQDEFKRIPFWGIGKDADVQCVEKIHEIAVKYENNHDIILYAHNSKKADYPLITKKLLQHFDKDATDWASSTSVSSYNWNRGEQKIQFQDSMNHFQMSLKEMGETYNCKSQKLECDHNVINIDNWETEFVRQKMEQYVMNDVDVLADALLTQNDNIQSEYGFQLLGTNNIMTSSSLATKVLFNIYYADPSKNIPRVYQIPHEFAPFIQKAYQGGSCSVFKHGHHKNQKVFAIDRNSAYPAAMQNYKKFAIGPYYYHDFQMEPYCGQRIPSGVYEIFIKDSPATLFPVFQTVVNGVSQPSRVKNLSLTTTSNLIEYAYKQGYTDMYLKCGVISENVGNMFEQFIKDHYKKRNNNKALMKAAEKKIELLKSQITEETEENKKELESLRAVYCKHNMLQLNDKLMMNSSYGKLGSPITQEVNEFTTNESIATKLLTQGVLTKFEEQESFGKKVYNIGGVQKLNNTTANMILAAQITAEGRIDLNIIQRDADRLGFECVYSDTDSVYFAVKSELNWTNKQINEAMDKLKEIHCDDFIIGKSKFETKDDIGDCLPEYNKIIAEGDEPLKYTFADEYVTLCCKSYALKSNYTGVCLLKGKGIPNYLFRQEKLRECVQKANIERTLWNSNERQFVFDDFVDCAVNKKAFEYKVTMSRVSKQSQFDQSKEHMKTVLKQVCKQSCSYKQKLVMASGLCIPKLIDNREKIDLTRIDEFYIEKDSDYIIFPTYEDIKMRYSITDEKWQHFLATHHIIRDERGGQRQFILFENTTTFKKYFNQHIKHLETKDRLFHYVNSTENQTMQFDFDAKGQELELIKLSGYTRESVKENIITALVQKYQLVDYDYELIDRSREEKISFHIRFDCNTTTLLYDTLTLRQVVCEHESLLQYLDDGPTRNSLRMTQQNDKFLFNPLNRPFQPVLSKKECDKITRNRKAKETKLNVQQKIQADESIMNSVQICLAEHKLQNAFKYKQAVISQQKKGSTRIDLLRIGSNDCKLCKRTHTSKNNAFIVYEYDAKKKKSVVELRCWTFIEESKAQQK